MNLSTQTAVAVSAHLMTGMHHSTPEGRAAIAALVEERLAPMRAAIKDLALAAAFCAEHRDRRTEVVPPFMGSDEHTVIHDLGPTEDAARCQAAIDKARLVMEALGLHLNQPPPIAPHSTIIR